MMKGITSISTNSFAKKVLYTIGIFGIGFLLMMSINRKSKATVHSHSIIIKPIKGERNLIEASEVNYIYKKYLGFNVLDAKISDLDTKELEERLQADKRIKKVEVFVDAHNNLNTWIIQRQPVVRIVDSKEFSYYIDEEGNDIPTKTGHAIRVPVATGYIDIYRSELINSDKSSALQNVFKCASHIMQDDFLNKFIEQIHVNADRDIELIPKVGSQYIILGDAQNLDKKFNDIKTIYKDGLPTVGWSKYKAINVKFDKVIYGIM